jgi:hypothetical protein
MEAWAEGIVSASMGRGVEYGEGKNKNLNRHATLPTCFFLILRICICKIFSQMCVFFTNVWKIDLTKFV